MKSRNRRNSNNNNNRGARRNHLGQGIVEGTVAICMITMLFVGLLMMGMNIYTVVSYDSVLRLVAQQSALAYDQHKYWLGMNRKDYSPSDAAADGKSLAEALAKTYGITLSDVQFTEPQLSVASAGNVTTTGITCTVSYDKLALPFGGGLFPLALARKVSATVADMSVPAPCYVDLNVFDPTKGTNTTLSMPAYFGYTPSAGSTPPSNGSILTASNACTPGSQQGYGPPIGNIRGNYYYGVSLTANNAINGPQNRMGTAGYGTLASR